MKHGKLNPDQTSLLFMTASPYAAVSYHTGAVYSPRLLMHMHYYLKHFRSPYLAPQFPPSSSPTLLFHIHFLRLGFCSCLECKHGLAVNP